MSFFERTSRHFDRFWQHASVHGGRGVVSGEHPHTTYGARIVAACMLLTAVTTSARLEVLVAIYGMCAATAYATRIPIRPYLMRTLVLVVVFVIPLTLPNVFHAVSRGQRLGPQSPLALSVHGVRNFVLVAVRALAAVSVAQLLLLSCGVHGLLLGLRQLRMPTAFITLFELMWTYLHVLGRVAHAMAQALRTRTIATLPYRRAYTIVGVQGSVLLQMCLSASRQTHQAMLARGFDGTFRHLPLHQRFCASDLVLLTTTALATCIGMLW